MTERLNYIDRLKGVAMLMVVIGHLILYSFKNANGNPIFAVCETTEMMLFSFLSGFVVTSMSFCKMLKKMPQLLLPMITVGLMYTFYSNKSLEDFIYSPFKHGYWYFLFLFYCYLCLCIINKFSFHFESKLLNLTQDFIWLAIFYTIIKFLRALLGISWDEDILSFSQFTGFWPYFMLGVITRKYAIVEWLKANNHIFSIALVLYPVFVYLYCTKGYIYMHMAALSSIVLLMYLFSKRERTNSKVDNVLGYVGKSSIDVYLFHFFFLNAINLQFVGQMIDRTHNYFLQLLFLITLALFLAHITILIGQLLRKSKMLSFAIYGKA